MSTFVVNIVCKHSLNSPPHSWGIRSFFSLIFPHNNLIDILQKIFKEHVEEVIYIQHPRDSVIENAEKIIYHGNPSCSDSITCIPLTGLPLCLLISSLSGIVTVCLPFPENSFLCFYMTVLFWAVFSLLLTVLSHMCSTKIRKQNFLLLVLSISFLPWLEI